MASGKFGSADLVAATDTLLYTAPAGVVATASISLCNRSAAPTTVRIALGSGANPAATDYVEYDTFILANSVLERTGIVLGAGEKIWARASTAGVSARAYGFEEAA